MDTATSDIRAVGFTPGSDDDSPVPPELLGQIPGGEEIGTVTAPSRQIASQSPAGQWTVPATPAAATPPSAARQGMFTCTGGIDRQATAIIPIRRNGRPWKEDCPAARARNETLRATRYYGRAFRTRWTGYRARSRIGARMRCLKAFGERVAARDPDRQTAETRIRVALMNRFGRGVAEAVIGFLGRVGLRTPT